MGSTAHITGGPNEQAPFDRRNQVRDMRTRLAQGKSVRPDFQAELLLMFVRNELGAIVTIPLLAIIFSLALMSWAPVMEALIWLLLVIAAKVLVLETCRRILIASQSGINVNYWKNRLVAVEFINGLAWSGIAIVGLSAANATSHVFVFASLIVVLAIRMTFASTVMTVLYAGTIPMTVAVFARLAMLNDPFYWAMASMAAGVHVYFIFLSKGLNSTALSMLEFRAQKDDLIAELEEEKWISDEARRNAETANVAKSRFLATMSHELRTPLNAILGFSEVMQNEILGPLKNETYKEYVDNIHSSGRHLLNLINEILDLSRIEAGRYELHEEPLRLTDIADDCQRLLKLRTDSKGLIIEENFDDGLEQIWGDERAIRQICLNLLSNALKFTPRGGKIIIAVQRTADGGQCLSVLDNGPGIPEDEIPKVLQAFGQGSLAHETAEGGTGLGLPIVKNLIQLHEGTFELRSELRKGTEAIIRFPKKRILQSMPPLQPLGAERHRIDLRPPPHSRPSRVLRALHTA